MNSYMMFSLTLDESSKRSYEVANMGIADLGRKIGESVKKIVARDAVDIRYFGKTISFTFKTPLPEGAAQRITTFMEDYGTVNGGKAQENASVREEAQVN